jgi:hypothetical protein
MDDFFRPKTDAELEAENRKKIEEDEEEKRTVVLLRKKFSELFRNETGVLLLKLWAKRCGFLQSPTVNSAVTSEGQRADPYKIAFYDGMQKAFLQLVDMLENDLLIKIVKKND